MESGSRAESRACLVHGHQPRVVGKRERGEQRHVDEREYGGVGANRDRKDGDDGEREACLSAQGADGGAEIVEDAQAQATRGTSIQANETFSWE
jgi:hypothetical protein